MNAFRQSSRLTQAASDVVEEDIAVVDEETEVFAVARLSLASFSLGDPWDGKPAI